MNTKREIIGEVEQMAINAIVHQPDEKTAAAKHFADAAKKIVEKAMEAVDIMEIGDVCRRAMTGAAIQDYDLLAKLLTDPDFDHERLAKSIEALASEKPIDYPTFYTPGWLVEVAKKMGGPRSVAAADGAASVPPAMPGKVVVHDEEVMRNPDKEKAPHIGYGMEVVRTPQTVVMRYTIEKSGRTISAEIFNESTSELANAYLYDDEKCVCQIKFFNRYQGRSWAYKIVRRAMNGLVSKTGKAARYRANRAAKLGGPLSVAAADGTEAVPPAKAGEVA